MSNLGLFERVLIAAAKDPPMFEILVTILRWCHPAALRPSWPISVIPWQVPSSENFIAWNAS